MLNRNHDRPTRPTWAAPARLVLILGAAMLLLGQTGMAAGAKADKSGKSDKKKVLQAGAATSNITPKAIHVTRRLCQRFFLRRRR